MNYPQTLNYLFEQLPMFQRIGAAAYKPNLNNTLKLMEALNQPHKKLKCVHVAGTNGKGSSSHMIASVLQQAGYKTGLYTSPHLVDFRERIKINGKLISKNYVVEFVEKYKTKFETIAPSFFEWTVALAFDYFVAEDVDVAIIEVGLGGRLDSTNVITPMVSLITNISFDHMNLLGDTLPKIASEKAGIIKHRVPTIVSQYQSGSAPVFHEKAKELKSELVYADKYLKATKTEIVKSYLKVEVANKSDLTYKTYTLDLTGSYQVKNLLGVLLVIKQLEKEGFLIEEKHIEAGLKNVCSTTGFAGRWQTLSTKPLVIADTGHNEDGIKQVIENISNLTYKKLHVVFGVVNDKDISKILVLLPTSANYYFVKANIPRALDANELTAVAKSCKLKGKAYPSVIEGFKAAKKEAKKEDLIFVGGSTFVVADLLANLSN